MADDDARALAEFANPRRHAFDRLNPVVQKINLPAACEFAIDGVADDALVVATDDSLDRLAIRRRGFDHGHVPRTHEREVERSRNRSRRKRKHIDEAEFFLKRILVLHAEALLLIDNDEAKILENDILRNDAVRSDYDIHTSFTERLDDLFLFRCGAVAAEEFDRDRILAHALTEILPVLLSQNSRRGDDDSLLSTRDGFEGRSDGDFSFPKPHIAANQAIHRARRLHVRLGIPDRLDLVWRFGEMKRTLELLLPVGVRRERVALRRLALRLHLEHAGGVLVDALSGFFLRFFPSRAAELGQLGIFAAESHIARNLPGLIQRHVEPGAVGEFQHQHLAFAVGRFFESLVAANAMVEMHHEVARLEFRKIHNRPARTNPLAPQRRSVRALACRAAKHLGLCKERQLRLRADESACGP